MVTRGKFAEEAILHTFLFTFTTMKMALNLHLQALLEQEP